jgi:hypothetical protein
VTYLLNKPSALILVCLLSLSFLVSQSFAEPLRFDGPGDGTAAFISPLERWFPTANIEHYMALLEGAGYSVDVILDEAASIEFFRSELSNYDLIVLRLDSFYYESLTYFCTGHTLEADMARERAEYVTEYAAEISAHELSLAGPCVGFSMLYILHNYEKASLHGLVVAFGSGTLELAAAFIEGGAAAFISYDSPREYSLTWGRYDLYTVTLLSILSEGYTVKNAIAEFNLRTNQGHGKTATWPTIYWDGDGDYTM